MRIGSSKSNEKILEIDREEALEIRYLLDGLIQKYDYFDRQFQETCMESNNSEFKFLRIILKN